MSISWYVRSASLFVVVPLSIYQLGFHKRLQRSLRPSPAYRGAKPNSSARDWGGYPPLDCAPAPPVGSTDGTPAAKAPDPRQAQPKTPFGRVGWPIWIFLENK